MWKGLIAHSRNRYSPRWRQKAVTDSETSCRPPRSMSMKATRCVSTKRTDGDAARAAVMATVMSPKYLRAREEDFRPA